MTLPASQDVFSPGSAGYWLWIVGIGEDGWEGLNSEAKQAIQEAELLFGGVRHLGLIPESAGVAARRAWPSPMSAAIEQILHEYRGQKKVAVLASGDPMLYGVGVVLTRQLAPAEFRVVPQVSSFSLACARLGWPSAATNLVTLVDRPVESLLCHLTPGARLVLFSEDGSTPAKVAQSLTRSGYGPSIVHLFENLGGSAERSQSKEAQHWGDDRCGKLNLVAVSCVADATARPLSLAPGLPEDAFETDGQLTKREVRAATLARLAPLPGQQLWDVGAGTGTIGIEWMRVHPTCSCVAFEQRADRARRIRANANRLGVPALEIAEGSAPATFAGREAPDTIFIGGGFGDERLFDACWERLRSGGRLMANAVTLQNEAGLLSCYQRYGGDLVRMMVSRAEFLGGTYGWRPMMPITQWMAIKP